MKLKQTREVKLARAHDERKKHEGDEVMMTAAFQRDARTVPLQKQKAERKRSSQRTTK